MTTVPIVLDGHALWAALMGECAMIRARQVTDHELWEYFDGGLPWLSRIGIAVQLAFDPVLARRAETFHRLARQIQSVEHRVLAESIPERFHRILRDARLGAPHGFDHRLPFQIQLVWLAVAFAAAGCIGWLAL